MGPPSPQQKPSRTLLVLLVLAACTLITLDARGGTSSPVEPARAAVGAVLGPVETVTSAAVRPFRSIGSFFTTTGSLRSDVARLTAENSRLKGKLATSAMARNRAAELDGLLASSQETGYALVPARVVAIGPAQSFSRTVTIDAGTSSGVHPDMTVLNNDGLVGRVLRADASTATVLLIVDQESVVGGRLGSDMEVGYLRGRGDLGGHARLDLNLVDGSAAPARGEVVATWGSKDDVPYVPGVPIGRVAAVYSSPRQLSERAVIKPFVDFSALDLVGVVVDKHTHGDRPLIKAGTLAGGPAQGDVAVSGVRAACLAALMVAAVVLQVSVFSWLAFDGVTPSLALLVVVAAALVRGPEFAAVLGFLGGLALDLAPPADHIAGRWALALVVVGYLAGRVRQDAGTSAGAALVAVAASSFVGTSIFVLSGMLLHDPDVPAAQALRVIPIGVGYDVLLTPFVLPVVMRLLRRLQPRRAAY